MSEIDMVLAGMAAMIIIQFSLLSVMTEKLNILIRLSGGGK